MSTSPAPRRVLVTGTSSGFGHGTAQALAARGHTVYATLRDVEGKNREVAQGLRAFAERGRHALHVIELDVTQDDSVAAAVERALQLGGGIDTVINNAGTGTFGLYETYTPAQFSALLEVNVVGSFRVARAVLPHLREVRGGHLVFLSSTLGRIVLPFMGPYTPTKFAVEAMADGFAIELRPLGIDVTLVQPGAYGTNFAAASVRPAEPGRLDQYGPVKDGFLAFGRAFSEMIESGRIGDPREVYDALVGLVEQAPGERPLRLTLDGQLGSAVEAINQTCAQVQENVLAGMGFGKR